MFGFGKKKEDAFKAVEQQQAATPAQEETVNFTIQIPKRVVLECMENQKKWQEVFLQVVPRQCMAASQNLKLFILNGFKPIENDDEFKAAEAKLIELEKPVPQIQVMPGNSKIPENVKKEIGNRQQRRHGRL